MDQQQLRSFVERYLQAMDCQIIESTPEMIDVQLSIEADQALLNRPFYWMYVEQMNLPAHPAQFRFFFTKTEESNGFYSDYLFFGSPRFTQMLNSVQQKGRFVRLYQQPKANGDPFRSTKGYRPIFAVHYLISYICDQKKDRISDLAIDLQTGEVISPFYQWAKNQQWSHQLPASRFLQPSQLSFPEAIGRLEAYLQKQIEQEDPTWAEEAKQRLAEEYQQIETYYPEDESMEEEQLHEKKQRLREIVWQFSPRVEINVVNAGLFYIEPHSSSSLQTFMDETR